MKSNRMIMFVLGAVLTSSSQLLITLSEASADDSSIRHLKQDVSRFCPKRFLNWVSHVDLESDAYLNAIDRRLARQPTQCREAYLDLKLAQAAADLPLKLSGIQVVASSSEDRRVGPQKISLRKESARNPAAALQERLAPGVGSISDSAR